jgi:hypothetical protein
MIYCVGIIIFLSAVILKLNAKVKSLRNNEKQIYADYLSLIAIFSINNVHSIFVVVTLCDLGSARRIQQTLMQKLQRLI